MRSLIYRPTQGVVLVFAALLLLALGVLGVMSWRDYQRLETIRDSIGRARAIQQAGLKLQHLLLEDLSGVSPAGRETLRGAAGEIGALAASGGALAAGMAADLARVQRLLAEGGDPPRALLTEALELMRRASYAETGAEARMLADIARDSRTEMQLTLAALFALPALLSLALWLMRRRIFNPINALGSLLSRLANGEFAPVAVHDIDPLLMPLFANYNQMVTRLEELERAHRSHAVSLQSEVDAAMRTLIQQQQSLARAERLAAVGELAANLAHELRNPLAGILLSLGNLRHDLQDAALIERLDLVIAELERLTRLLNEHLAQARHAPEPPRWICLAALVRELLALTRYQAPGEVAFRQEVAEALECRLPEGRLRQALLNLLLNAVQALGEGPGTITVSARLDGGQLACAVEDDGPGFPQALLDNGARSFVSLRESGTGLGLVMVQRFCRELGGRLLLQNGSPRGACATLLLPCETRDG